MKILTFTTLYPNDLQPRHGIFVKNRMVHLQALKDVEYSVIAPVSDTPILKYIKNSRFQLNSQISLCEDQEGVKVSHPKYLSIPKITHNVTQIYKAGLNEIKGDVPDIIDGQYLYPDGVSAYKLAKKLNRPLVLTARGSDVNFWMKIPEKRTEILESIDYASHLICVSAALKKSLIDYGVEEEKISLLYNGINHDVFSPKNRSTIPEYFIIVGNLVALKGQKFVVEAMASLPDQYLKIIGSGEDEALLKSLAEELNVAAQIEFIPYVDQQELSEYYSKAKATILMSSMEGMPNVILESLASGCPVIATNVGGVPEVVNEENGILLAQRDASTLVHAIEKLLSQDYKPEKISATVAHMDWQQVAQKQYEIYETAVKNFTFSL